MEPAASSAHTVGSEPGQRPENSLPSCGQDWGGPRQTVAAVQLPHSPQVAASQAPLAARNSELDLGTHLLVPPVPQRTLVRRA